LEEFIPQTAQQANSTAACIRDICRNAHNFTAGKVAMLIWVLWNNRNNCVWNNTKESGQQLGYKAKCLWNEWNAVQNIRGSTRIRQQQVHSWQKPQQQWYKCNVDAGFHNAAGKTSVGWCVRDSTGRFVITGSSWINGRCSIMEGEAIAILEAMKELQQRGYTNVIFETDSQTVENSIHNIHSGVSEFSSIVWFGFPPFEIPHTLTRAAVSWPSRYIFELSPLCIEELLYNEML
ncbi:cytochrome P450, partial [Trifolium medium]|nr:cytochrome P450 [Trifolium medium]